MKKLLAGLLICIMALSFTACGGSSSDTPGDALGTEFLNIVEAGELVTALDIAQALTECDAIPDDLGMIVSPVEEGFLQGFTEDVTGFSEGAVFAPGISSIPFIGYVFVTDDPEKLKNQLLDTADTRWNICTEADKIVNSIADDKLLFVMTPKDFN